MPGRPKKNTVDYFPHYVNASSKKTIFILESRFGNDGYSFWFKLLELLGDTEGHIYDCRNAIAWQFLQAKMHLSEDLTENILQLLSELGAIDVDLWKKRVIWCQNLVNNVSDVYKNRRVEIPQKPIVFDRNDTVAPISTDDNTNQGVISTDENTHSIVKDSIVEDSIKENNKKKRNIDNNSIILPEWINQEVWDEYLIMRKEKKSMPTRHAKELLIKTLGKLREEGDEPNTVLERSIMNGWKGVFKLDKGVNHGTGTHKQHPGQIPDHYVGQTP